jgi:hypothetical protein
MLCACCAFSGADPVEERDRASLGLRLSDIRRRRGQISSSTGVFAVQLPDLRRRERRGQLIHLMKTATAYW